MKKAIVIIIVMVCISGCAGFGGALFHDVKAQNLYLGMTTTQVRGVMGSPGYNCTSTSNSTEGRIDIWDYATSGCGFNLSQSYALVFKNDVLVDIRTVRTRAEISNLGLKY